MSQILGVATKNPGETIDFAINYSDSLEDGETITNSTWSVPSDLNQVSSSIIDNSTSAQVVLSGGTLNEAYDVTNTTTTSGGSVQRTFVRTIRVVIQFRSNVDRIRLLVGDQDENDQLLEDDSYVFALDEAGNNKFRAAAIICRSIAGKFARLVNTDFEGVSSDYSDRQKHYRQLAKELEQQAKRQGGLGSPRAGGISIDQMDFVERDDDRPDPAFRRRQFRNPPNIDDIDEYRGFYY
jgi:hypothetical protein